MSRRAWKRAVLASSISFGFATLAGPGPGTALAAAPSVPRGNPPAVSVGEVVVLAGPDLAATPELRRQLREALTEELTRFAERDAPEHRPLVISATLTKLSSEQRAQQTKATAAISLALRRADDQVLFAEVVGRASAEETRGDLASLRRAALRGAIRGAVARLPEAVQRSR